MALYRGNLPWRKNACPRRKINTLSKKNGQIGVCVGLFFCLIVMVAVVFEMKVLQYHAVSAFVEDGLAASNLASAVIDLKEYGTTHNILVESPESAFYRYKEALIYNLKLDENLRSTREEVLWGKVDILSYQVFNVVGDSVFCYRFDEGGRLLDKVTLDLDAAYLPDGNKLETTSIYSKVGFSVKGLKGGIVYGTKEKSVDIKREESM